MNGVLSHDSVVQGYSGSGAIWVNEMNVIKNHAADAGSIGRPVDLQSSALPLCQTFING